MRIAFITYEFPPDTGKGGIGTYTQQAAEMLAKENWDVHVFCGSLHRNASSLVNAVNIHWVKCNSPQDFTQQVLPAFTAEHSNREFQVTECPEIHGNAAAIKNAFPQLPLVVRLHAPGWLVEHFKKRYISFWAKLRYVLGALRRFRADPGYWKQYDKKKDPDYQFILNANIITAPSAIMKDWVVKNWHIAPAKIRLLPNVFSPLPALLGLPLAKNDAHKTVLFYGRLNVLKGLVNATFAMKQVLANNPDWSFKIVGDDGPAPDGKGSMKAWIETALAGYHNRISIEPGIKYEDMPAMFEKAGIVLLPSLFESFSYTCLEAMAAGRPVTGSKGTGMESIIDNGVNGLLADAENVDHIAMCLQALIDDEQRHEMGARARTTAQFKFSEKELAQKYMNVYREAAGNA